MKNIITFALCAILIASCNNNSKTTLDVSKLLSEAKGPELPKSCYIYSNAGDTVSLKLINLNTSVMGILTYNLREKDKNSGMVKGHMHGDMFLADYTFQSEGITSVRQVAFRKEGDAMVEGYGDVIEESGKIKFKDTARLNFDGHIRLVSANCE